MAQPPLDLNVPFRPITWPQDTLKVPNGQGRMPEVDYLNATKVKREFFVYSGQTANIAAGQSQILNIPIRKDADFWINSVACIPLIVGINSVRQTTATFTMVDSLTKHSFYTPVAPINFITQLLTPVGSGPTGDPSIFMITGWVEPYCVLRGGNVQFEIFAGSGDPTIAYYFALAGWKEYANAAK